MIRLAVVLTTVTVLSPPAVQAQPLPFGSVSSHNGKGGPEGA